MTNTTDNDAQMVFHLSCEAKAIIEEAATLCGQTVSEFTILALLERANHVLDATPIRALFERDARIFLEMLDKEQPNAVLRDAAAWYKETQEPR